VGGGIYQDGSASPYILPSSYLSNVVQEDNSAQAAGGGIAVTTSRLELEHVTLRSNTGGGLDAKHGVLTIRDSKVYSNSTWTAAAVS